jgi:hypothetical protein
MSKVRVTWEDDTQTVFNDIPANIEEAKARAALEAKFKKKIKSFARIGSAPLPGTQDDRNSSSQTTPAKPDTSPQTTKLPGERDEEPDYRDKFPDKFTPKNMRRNKWGELIYE